MSEAGQQTGVKDKNYNLISVLYHSSDNVLTVQQYVEDARREGDEEAATFFQNIVDNNQKAVEQAKQMLSQRL
ncbi:Hypothetical Protein RradSPS_1737 [Rubrobacter radiotolerans]|uniref:DUF4142 domain-containing protein n=1 Tax=Rubrobacter radiotolerans TaxID=42256 RepID=A0A023X4V3_RUBRA|nr:hypothetical protein [Rubrobacter radiotolerans]AHY47020.1 Hypothetical Protein RradSPS_1737 [Rubrobacter radiotolerans]MDX5894426.1 hypothetical protein [Rubrobacter radiotolerans]SMC05978.1 conserved hypothetical protein [Rubrobacter radiotolerans DSM 5868]